MRRALKKEEPVWREQARRTAPHWQAPTQRATRKSLMQMRRMERHPVRKTSQSK
jgi:hypothetical protein